MAVALLLLLLLAGPLRAQSVATVRPQPAMLSLAPGAEGTLEIVLENARDVYGIDVQAAFDPARVEVVDADPERGGVQLTGGTFPQPDFIAANTADNAAGTLRYVATQVNPTPPATGSGIVFSVRLRARSSGETTLTITSVEMADRDGFLLAVTPGATTITIAEGAAVPTSTGIPLRPNDTPVAGEPQPEEPPGSSTATGLPTDAPPVAPSAVATVDQSLNIVATATSEGLMPSVSPTTEAEAQGVETAPDAVTAAPPPNPAVEMTVAPKTAPPEMVEPDIMPLVAEPVAAVGDTTPVAEQGEPAIVGQSTGLTAGQPALPAAAGPTAIVPYGLAMLLIIGVGVVVWLVRRGRS